MSVFRILLFLPLLTITHVCFAATVSLHTLSADATLAGINDNFSTLGDEINGNLEGGASGSTINIKADSLGRS